MGPLSISPSICKSPFSPSVLIFLNWVFLSLLSFTFFCFPLFAWRIFLTKFDSLIFSVYTHCLYKSFQYFSFLANILMSINIRCLIFSYGLLKFVSYYAYPFGGVHGVMVIVVGNGHDDTISKSWTRLIAFHIALIPLGKV